MTKKIIIAKIGKNAETATDPNDFIFHSDYNTFKIISTGILSSQLVNANPTTFSVAHSQSAIPAVFAFAKFPDGYIVLPGEREKTAVSGATDRYWILEVDGTNVYFIFYKGVTANYSVDIKYYIFEAPGT
jgi:hypothetical protein